MIIPGITVGCGDSGPVTPPPSTTVEQYQDVPAFPGAEGWGATALNASRELPLVVHFVTTTATTGPGSLGAALAAVRNDHFDVILFRTGGRIMAPSPDGFRLNASHVYIAGQTAPGDGVAIEGEGTSFWFRGGGENVTDVVVRHIRFRGRHGSTNNNLIVTKGERLVLDHLSFSWADNYLFALLRYDSDFSAPIADVSIQNSIFSEIFATHPTAAQLATNNALGSEVRVELSNVALHRNLFAHNSHRNPNSGADNITLVNNVLYNWNQGTMQMTQRGTGDFVNNFGRAGPMTHPAYRFMVNPRCTADRISDDYSIYAVGNVGPESEDPDGDNWLGPTRQVSCYYRSGTQDGEEVPHHWRRDSPQPWQEIAFPVSVLPAPEAFHRVLQNVGANARITCDGQWVPALDAVDSRVVSDVRFGVGPDAPVPNENAVGGWPEYQPGTPCTDSDGDGLPDAWETAHFGCATCGDPSARGRDGYLVIEHFLNGTAP
jgi:hypothetical protein